MYLLVYNEYNMLFMREPGLGIHTPKFIILSIMMRKERLRCMPLQRQEKRCWLRSKIVSKNSERIGLIWMKFARIIDACFRLSN